LCDDPGITHTYDLFHLGLGGHHGADEHVPVSFLTDGSGAMREALVAARIDVAIMWSLWPETYSFTTSEAISAGCVIIASSTSGNAAELVRRYDAGVVAESEAELRRVLLDQRELRRRVSAAGARGWSTTPRFAILDELVTPKLAVD
jgi:hypothetical protein